MPRLLPLALVVIACTLTACGDPKVDGSSDERFEASMTRLRDGLDEHEREELARAVVVILGAEGVRLEDLTGDERASRLSQRLDGKTASAIIREADAIRERQEAERATAEVARVQALVARMAADDEAWGVLDTLNVRSARLGRAGKTLEMEVKNAGPTAMARVTLRAIAITPGRAIPWVDTLIDHPIPGGLEAGESAWWSIPIVREDNWQAIPPDGDAVIIARAEALLGPEGRVIAGRRFGREDEAALIELLDGGDHAGSATIKAAMAARRDREASWREAAIERQRSINEMDEALAGDPEPSADEIIASVEEDGSARRIDELLGRLSRANDGRRVLASFEVESSRFRPMDGDPLRQPIIETTVRHGLETGITRVAFDALVLRPGDDAPILEARVEHRVASPLRAGEPASWSVHTGPSGTWVGLPMDEGELVVSLFPALIELDSGASIDAAFSPADATELLDLMRDNDDPRLDTIEAAMRSADEAEARRRRRVVQTAAEAVAERRARAESARAAVAGRRAALAAQIREFEAKRDRSEESARQLAQFKINHARFYFARTGFGEEPTIEMNVENTTPVTISAATFDATVTSEGRRLPWLATPFTHEVPEGIRPGERVSWIISPNRSSGWADLPKDVGLSVAFVTRRLNGPGGDVAYQVDWTDADAAILAQLIDQHEQLSDDPR